MDKETILKKYWGFTSFRPLQKEIIDSVLSGKDTIALLPTGGGKSLCFQLPALVLEGFVLVVSPLIALMEDQVQSLLNKGIKAMYFESHPKSLPLDQQIDNCIHGNYKIVYVSPERLIQKTFIQRLSHAPLSMVAIDEAHCISEWGHDFRPAYRKINLLKDAFPNTVFLTLTASATKEVLIDIKNQLDLKKPVLFQRSFERPNIMYKIWKTEDKYHTVVQILKYFRGSSIVYCTTRRQTEQLSRFLNQSGIQADFFHGGLFAAEKKSKLDTWQKNKCRNMIATTAFGMGVDKPDVRTIIHLNIPLSIENYYQETGRAGRDGLLARSFLLFHPGDFQELKNQFLNTLPTAADLKTTYKDLCNFLQIPYGQGFQETFTLDLVHFCRRYDRSERKTIYCLEQFHQEGIITVSSSKENQLLLQAQCSPDQAKELIQQNSLIARILEYLMRQFPYFFNESITLEPKKIRSSLRISDKNLLVALRQLQEDGYLRYSQKNKSVYLTFQTPREDDYTVQSLVEHAYIKYNRKKEKIEKMIGLVKDRQNCINRSVLNYFGTKNSKHCDQCSSDSCKGALEVESGFEEKVLTLLKQKPHSISELKQKLYFEPQALHQFLESLLIKEQVQENAMHKFYWNYE
ncbi:MAG: ATP-dependent DNA helicase RecQ [Flavobacteriaceae bacterium]